MSPSPAGWLASGGSFWLIFGQTAVIAAISIVLAFRIANALRAESDGCLLAIANLILTCLGAGIGFFLAPYPVFIVSAFVGAVALPGLATSLFIRRYRR